MLLYAQVRDIKTAIGQPVTIANPVETVTIANPVETVTIANPVETVTIANPVDEVKVTNIVEVASPRDATLYGYCYPKPETDGYEVRVVAFGGGLEKVVASGSKAPGAATSIALAVVDYYGGPGLGFGTASEGCHHLEGWGS